MSYLEYTVRTVPSGPRKLLAVGSIGFLMLYSVAGGSLRPWADPQIKRFGLGLAIMFVVAFVPISVWRSAAGLFYALSIVLLLGVEFFGSMGMGAQRWINLGFMRLQPSELVKVTLVMALAAYYDWLPPSRVSRPLWLGLAAAMILLPIALILRQPDLGTALIVGIGGAAVMFVAGVHWLIFAAGIALGGGAIALVLTSRGTGWQLLKDYQFARIDTFLDPARDPLGAGYHITQSKIALGSGKWTGRGFMQGTQSRLNFLPEKHTDFIFTTLAEEFGFIGAGFLLALYLAVLVTCVIAALRSRNRFASLLILGIAGNFFLYFAVNMAMVMGLAPVVGVPLPLVSWGGSSMMMILIGFGLVQSACVHRPREKS
jgi:rod shape determining protein RodA